MEDYGFYCDIEKIPKKYEVKYIVIKKSEHEYRVIRKVKYNDNYELSIINKLYNTINTIVDYREDIMEIDIENPIESVIEYGEKDEKIDNEKKTQHIICITTFSICIGIIVICFMV